MKGDLVRILFGPWRGLVGRILGDSSDGRKFNVLFSNGFKIMILKDEVQLVHEKSNENKI